MIPPPSPQLFGKRLLRQMCVNILSERSARYKVKIYSFSNVILHLLCPDKLDRKSFNINNSISKAIRSTFFFHINDKQQNHVIH